MTFNTAASAEPMYLEDYLRIVIGAAVLVELRTLSVLKKALNSGPCFHRLHPISAPDTHSPARARNLGQHYNVIVLPQEYRASLIPAPGQARRVLE